MKALEASRVVSVLFLGAFAVLGCSKKLADASAERTVDKGAIEKATRGNPGGTFDGPALPDVASRVLPSVVSVASTRVSRREAPDFPLPDDPFLRRFFGPDGPFPFQTPGGQDRVEHGLGSGVIVGKDTILTNAHVVEGAKELEVTGQNKRRLMAKVVGSDTKSDLAVLKIEGDVSGLTPLPFADSSKLRLGQIVLAVGNPFGIGQTVTMGIVSATSRADLGIEAYEDFIQTDAAINPGNSGGALVNLDGELVGVPTAILSRTGGSLGVGFAIPSNMAAPIVKSLLEHGRVERGFLGVTIQNLDPDLGKALGLKTLDGVLIADVLANGPAAKAGLRRGDVVLTIDGKPVQTTGEFRNLVASTSVGKSVSIELLRGGEKKTVKATLGRQPAEEPAAQKPGSGTSDTSAGLLLAPLDAGLREKLGAPTSLKGVVVTGVKPGSPAAAADLEEGDVIVEAGGQPIENPTVLANRWQSTKDALALVVWRKQHTFYAVLKR